MTWADYVFWTDTTALPVTADPEYIRLGVLEEVHECLAAYANLQAVLYGRQKRVLRGDSEATLQTKDQAATKARAQLVEELGDLAWYVARFCEHDGVIRKTLFENLGSVSVALRNFFDFSDRHHACRLLECMLSMSGIDLSTVLNANVAKLTARKSAGTLKGEGTR